MTEAMDMNRIDSAARQQRIHYSWDNVSLRSRADSCRDY